MQKYWESKKVKKWKEVTEYVKCTMLKCPDCGHTMIREELLKK